MRDVIIALDFPDRDETLAFLKKFGGEKPYVKIGMELFYGEGPDLVRQIKDLGHPVFLDLKLHDIPNTVERAMTNLARLKVDMVNVHATGTRTMMQAAKTGLLAGGGDHTKIIAVTQLTSTSEDAMRIELLIARSMEEAVATYANSALMAGMDGVVCSPLEVRRIKAACGMGFLTVTPGIRYPNARVVDDQKRVTTPAKAHEMGSDFIVVGRPITRAEDPVAVYRQMKKEFLTESEEA